MRMDHGSWMNNWENLKWNIGYVGEGVTVSITNSNFTLNQQHHINALL